LCRKVTFVRNSPSKIQALISSNPFQKPHGAGPLHLTGSSQKKTVTVGRRLALLEKVTKGPVPPQNPHPPESKKEILLNPGLSVPGKVRYSPIQKPSPFLHFWSGRILEKLKTINPSPGLFTRTSFLDPEKVPDFETTNRCPYPHKKGDSVPQGGQAIPGHNNLLLTGGNEGIVTAGNQLKKRGNSDDCPN